MARAQDAAPLPLVGHWTLDDVDGVLKDSGPNKLNGKLNGATSVNGKIAKALQFKDGSSTRIDNNPILNGADKFTLSLWMKIDKPADQPAGVVSKRDQNSPGPYILSVGKENRLGCEGFDGSNWFGLWPETQMPVARWFHVALTYRQGDKVRIYQDGREIGSADAPRAMAANDQGLNFGKDPFRGNFAGQLDDVRIFAAALSPAQVTQLVQGVDLPTRAATKNDIAKPTHTVEVTLGRYDLPIPDSEGLGQTRMKAERLAGPDAVDWPKIFWRDQILMKDGSSEKISPDLREGDTARGLFMRPDDEILYPGKHAFRPLQWLWGHRYVYHADRTARSKHDNFELWVFPVKVIGNIESVILKNEGREIYNRQEKLNSLTLLIPQNEPGKPYEISVNGKAFQSFDAGLKPVIVGAPKDEVIEIAFKIAETDVTVANLEKPHKWMYEKEWAEDVAAQAAGGTAEVNSASSRTGFARYLGTQVPRSPLEIYTVSLPHGMSGGHFMRSEHKSSGENALSDPKARFEAGDAADYADFLADTGYDLVYEMAGDKAFDKGSDRSYSSLSQALADRGLKFGIVPGVDWKRPFLAHPNLGFFSLNLPDYRAPLYRDLQLFSQRLNRNGNFAGVSIGADNAAYESFWAWAPPEPSRPWGEAFVNFASEGKPTLQRELSWPEPKGVGGKSSVAEFQEYIARYNKSFEQYGYYHRALTEIDPALSATTGSYGSSPGVGARGGYPWATIPAKSIFAGLEVMQAYDWNEVPSSKPLHNVALLDRARSYYPDKKLRSLVDDFGLFFGREARQRAYLLVATRGIDTIGTSFLASPTNARPRVYGEQKELYGFLKSRGGAFRNTRPDAQIGVLYVNEQALLRKPNQESNPSDQALFDGSHEGKTTEALILCHAAGFPAKIITPEELKRGLSTSMKAVLLVGLNREDETWLWSDGLEADLTKFIAGGGKILRDAQSVSPVDSIETGIKVRAYIAQGAGTEGGEDRMPLILERNQANIGSLKTAMAGIEKPVAKSEDPTIWAVPHTTGDVQYVTVVNWGHVKGKNASRVVKPQTGTLKWNTTKAIYDLDEGKATTLEAAKAVDLTRNGFQIYALPSKAVSQPVLTTSVDADGFYQVKVDVSGMKGVPVEIKLVGEAESAIVSGASGENIKLPFRNEEATTIQLTATELLSGLTANLAVTTTDAGTVNLVEKSRLSGIQRFMERRDRLVLALTPAQDKDPVFKDLAGKLATLLESKGRKVELGSIAPNGVVSSPQPLKTSQTFPRWRTVEADLVLLGHAQNNLLIFDQVRGGILGSTSGAFVTYSPFVGEHQVLNFVGDAEQIQNAVIQWGK